MELGQQQAQHTFLVRILDDGDLPVHFQVVRSIEEGEALYNTMLNSNAFLEDERTFEISQGAIILEEFIIQPRGGDIY